MTVNETNLGRKEMKISASLFVVGIATALLFGCLIAAQTPPTPTPLLPVYSADGSSVPNVHIVIGQISVPAGPPKAPLTPPGAPEEFPVTLSNAAAFTSADSYKCFLAQPYGLGSGGIVRIIDGNQFVYRGARSGPAWQQNFLCIGN
jgi:hypothetical protein